jgi:hypothetical protein
MVSECYAHLERALASELVGVVDLLRAGRSGARIPTGTGNFLFSINRPDRLGGSSALIFSGRRGSLPAVTGWDVKWATHF